MDYPQVLLIWSLKRSGAHGVEQWLFPHFKKKVFINNANPSFPLTHHPKDERGDILALGIEDKDFSSCYKEANKIVSGKLGEFYRSYTNVIVIRDPFNMFASRLQRRRKPDLEMLCNKWAIELWKKYARECLGDTNHLDNKICIDFNQWFWSLGHRVFLAKTFEVKFTDAGKETFGARPSSFDENKYRGRASQLNVLDRWRNFIDDEEYLNICADKEMIELSERVFGGMPQELKKKLLKRL